MDNTPTTMRKRKATKMSDKWIVTVFLGFIVIMFSPLVIMEYGNNQCRIEAIKAGVEADKIKTACGFK